RAERRTDGPHGRLPLPLAAGASPAHAGGTGAGGGGIARGPPSNGLITQGAPLSGTSTIEVPAPAALLPDGGARPRRRPGVAAFSGAGSALSPGAIRLGPLRNTPFLCPLRRGHWILNHGIPRADLSSFTVPNAPWVVQSWLAEALYATIDAAV